MYYDRQGKKISVEEMARLTDRVVLQSELPDGRWISTVWLGIDHSFGSGPPVIFETMVFPSRRDFGELDCCRYSTETEAREGHVAMVARWTEKMRRELN